MILRGGKRGRGCPGEVGRMELSAELEGIGEWYLQGWLLKESIAS